MQAPTTFATFAPPTAAFSYEFIHNGQTQYLLTQLILSHHSHAMSYSRKQDYLASGYKTSSAIDNCKLYVRDVS
jgi:hypothetical protein